jgi:flagellar basal body rod protein FlgC
MEAQRAALDIDARNVAAAETGAAFDRLVPRFEVARRDDPDVVALPDPESTFGGGDAQPFIRFTGTTTERGNGVDAITEMVAVLNAQRAYEADASVFEAGKRLAERTIDVGRA